MRGPPLNATQRDVLLAMGVAARTGVPAPTRAALAAAMGLDVDQVGYALRKLVADGRLRLLERRRPDFARYEVVGVGPTGDRVPCPRTTSSTFPYRHARTKPRG